MDRNVYQRRTILPTIALLAIVGALATTSNAAIAQDNSTTTQQVIESRGLGQDLVLDANDHPVLAYQHVSPRGRRSLKVARCTDVSCDGVLVAGVASLEPGLPIGTGTTRLITLMIDSNDRPVVGYTQANELRVARCLDRLCRRVNLQTLGPGQLAAFALDQNDLVVAAYATESVEGDSSAWAIDLARCDNKQCSTVTTSRIEIVEQSAPPRAALAIDSNNNPVLSYTNGDRFDSPNSALIARCLDPVCDVINKITIIENGFLDPPVMVLNSVDNPIVTLVDYQGIIEDLTHYVACLDADCNTRQERSLRTRWEHNLSVNPRSLALAADGSVFFLTTGESDGNLWPEVWRCESISCDTFDYRGLISGTPVLGGRLALAVDQAGDPVVAFSGRINPISGIWASAFSPILTEQDFPDLTVARCGSAECVNLFDVEGMFYFQNVRTGRYLGLDADGTVGTSSRPGSNELWDVDVTEFGDSSIRNVEFDQYLDLLRNAVRVLPDRRTPWLPIRPDMRGIGSLREVSSLTLAGEETGSGVEVVRASFLSNPEPRVLWRIVSTDSVAPNRLVGTRIAFQNMVTGRWLDNDPNGAVDQSVNQSADDVWLVQDAGDGYVYLVNDFTGLYLDADEGRSNLDSSSTLALDKRWDLRFAENKLTIRSVRFDGYVTAQGRRNAFNSSRQSGLTASSYWLPLIVE